MVFRTFVRYLHDSKLPTVIPKAMPIQTNKIGTKSPKKSDNNNIYNHFSNLKNNKNKKIIKKDLN